MTLEEQATGLSAAEIVQLLQENQRLRQQTAELQQQTAWFKRQLFGVKSERRLLAPDSRQLSFAGMEMREAVPPPPTETVKAYRRRQPLPGGDPAAEGGLRFDASVPVEEIAVPNPELTGHSPEEYAVIGEKITYRLAQKPGAYVVLKYVRHVVKLRETETLSCPPAPPAVFERSVADVSFLAGLLLDKFRYHLPLYRQHQRLAHAGLTLSRVTLTNLVHRTAALLEPLYYALLSSILQSQVLLMDETPIKAGRKAKGRMQTGYFWPIYGDQEEVAFPFAASRAGSVVREALGEFCGVLVTDGYRVYARYAATVNAVVHAQCWVHARRHFVAAANVEPQLVAQALDTIGQLYAHEATIRERQLDAEHTLACVFQRRWASQSRGKRPLIPREGGPPNPRESGPAIPAETGPGVGA